MSSSCSRISHFFSGVLMAAPMAVLSLLLIFSHDYFHTTLISCSLRSTPEYGQESDPTYRSYRYDYSFFDYNFVQVFWIEGDILVKFSLTGLLLCQPVRLWGKRNNRLRWQGYKDVPYLHKVVSFHPVNFCVGRRTHKNFLGDLRCQVLCTVITDCGWGRGSCRRANFRPQNNLWKHGAGQEKPTARSSIKIQCQPNWKTPTSWWFECDKSGKGDCKNLRRKSFYARSWLLIKIYCNANSERLVDWSIRLFTIEQPAYFWCKLWRLESPDHTCCRKNR